MSSKSFLYSLIKMTLTEEHRGYLEINGPMSNILHQIVKKEGKQKIGLKGIRRIFIRFRAVFTSKERSEKVSQRHFLTNYIDTIRDGDLQDVRNISKDNEIVQYILVLQNIFSRFLFTTPLKQKRQRT